jgi:hypothetical protein
MFSLLNTAENITQFTAYYLIMMILGMIIIGIIWVMFKEINTYLGINGAYVIYHGDIEAYRILLLWRAEITVLFGVFLIWSILFLDGLFTLLGALLVQASRIVVYASRAVMWRIASYPKGPLAAVVLIFGFFLGIARVFLSK